MTMNKKELTILFSVGALYLSWFTFVVGIKPVQIFLFVSLTAMVIAGSWWRRSAFALTPYLVYVSVYDSLKAFPNYLYNTIHIEDLYLLEKQFFGVSFQDQILTLNEYFNYHQHVVWDIISGVSYLTWVPMPLGFALLLYLRKNKRTFINFSLVFILSNLLGFGIYYLYPAAPPWYVDIFGYGFAPDTACAVGRLGNFDNLLGFPIFKYIYQNNTVVFAAVPSMHAANPLSCLLVGLTMKNRWPAALFFLVTCGMWFGAVYSNHHYLIDVFAGAAVSLVAFSIVFGLLRRTAAKKYLIKFEEVI
jgi:inositol phosphorylceramide synthase catalytic subunit